MRRCPRAPRKAHFQMKTLPAALCRYLRNSVRADGLTRTCERFGVDDFELFRALACQPIDAAIVQRVSRVYYRCAA
jgi:hypothetical protein